jgi:hypothetical protein
MGWNQQPDWKILLMEEILHHQKDGW